MNATDHNKILGIIHTAYGIMSVVTLAIVSVFMLVMFGVVAATEREAMPLIIVAVVMFFVVAINIIFTLPSILAGYALLKRKRWAKTACVVAAVIDGMSVPFGTALCIYTLWFMFSDQGRLLYDNVGAGALPPPPPSWANESPVREAEYIPPASPPNWR
jgi:hypothetical protein